MEGVGARLGRSSTRYGPTTVFTGPVRKWKKKWIHVSAPNASSNLHSQTPTLNATTNCNNASHLLLYKWTPISQTQNTNANASTINNVDTNPSPNDDDDDPTAVEEPPRRKFKYIPVAVLEEQNKEEEEGGEQQVEDEEAKPSETDLDETAAAAAEPASKNRDAFDEKPDINDTPMEEDSEESKDNLVERQDLNESTLDLSLGLKSRDGDNDSDDAKDGQELERVNSGT